MRQLLVHVPQGSGNRVRQIADDLDAISTLSLRGEREGAAVDVVITHLSNGQVEPFLERVEALPDVHLAFYPESILALKPPPSKAADQVMDVQPLSPIEVFLAGYQSVGSWGAFLGYAAVAGAVAWVALFVGSSYLLIAAMLVAPFAGPAMNAAIATASGEGGLLRRSLVRYVAALVVTAVVTFILTLLVGPSSPSPRMLAESQVASIAVVLPLVAGAAGAAFLQTSARSSLVSGAAVGVLVAASLAPPAALVGMSAALGRWDMVANSAFVLALQLVGIHLSGSVVFRLFGLSHDHARHGKGNRHLFPAGLAVATLALAGLLTLQFADPVSLNRTTLAQDMGAAIESAVSETPVRPEHVAARFLQTPGGRAPVLLAEVFVRRDGRPAAVLDSVSQSLTRQVRERLRDQWPDVAPLLDVRWVEGP